MKQIKKRLHKALLLGVAAFCLSHSSDVLGAKLDIYVGAFQFEASTSSDSGSVSNLGFYKLGYYLPLLEKFELGLGYTVIMSDIISGDSAFGFEVEAFYFPLTATTASRLGTDSIAVKINPLWRPFVMGGFHARQFQSVSTQYTGFGLGGGFERALNEEFDLKVLFRYIGFVGPSSGEATEISLSGGVTFSF